MKYRNDIAHTESMWGGDVMARFRNAAAVEARIYRRGYTEYGLENRSVYVQDTFSLKRFTLNAGFRFDHQTDHANPAEVSANWMYGQPTYSGVYNGVTYNGAPFNQLPGIAFPGADAGLAFNNWSPRAGLTYDLTGNGRSVVKLNYARYVGQLGTGDISSTYNTVQSTYVQYPWVDVNGDRYVQANEVVLTAAPLGFTTGYDYLNPTRTTTPGSVDASMTADTADEFLATFDKQIASTSRSARRTSGGATRTSGPTCATTSRRATGRRCGGRRPPPAARPGPPARRSPTTSRPSRSPCSSPTAT